MNNRTSDAPAGLRCSQVSGIRHLVTEAQGCMAYLRALRLEPTLELDRPLSAIGGGTRPSAAVDLDLATHVPPGTSR